MQYLVYKYISKCLKMYCKKCAKVEHIKTYDLNTKN